MIPTMTFETWWRERHPTIPVQSALAVVRLALEGATLPFIARYRKEQTGNLDEVAIQAAIEGKDSYDAIVKRQTFIVEEIEKQKKLTPELKERILATFEAGKLEDLYLPYKQKRKTKAATAKEAGLEPLADWIWNTGHGIETPQPGQTLALWAETYKNPEKEIADGAAAIAGAQDILVERIAENIELREFVRKMVFGRGFLKSKKGEAAKEHSKFDKYFDYKESVASLLKPENSHRYLAVKRGWNEKELQTLIGPAEDEGGYEDEILNHFVAHALSVADAPGADVLKMAARLAYKAYVGPAIDTEVHKELKSIADVTAIKVFAENVRKLLLASPFGAKAVLGVDPGIRTGCKLAVVDGSGKYVASTVIHLNGEEAKKTAAETVKTVVAQGILAVAVGNGTAGRETETFLRATLKEAGLNVPVVMVSEAGASVYSASDTAREEFPDLDVTVRGAISIARRLQDPLAELVKVDPKSIGVGQYQHDVSQSGLKKGLDSVVDSCVNAVGVNLNTASYHLLARVSGIGPALAKGIVEHRAAKGLFHNRRDLLAVSRFSEKTFEQAAGFLRISGGNNPLDNTGVHPERYSILTEFAGSLGKNLSDLVGSGVSLVRESKDLEQKIGAFTFNDIVAELEKPGRDPRDEFIPFSFRDDISEVSDLKPGMTCPGIVTNVTNFGAFVDVGVHQDGLVHISQLCDRFVKDPREVVSPGDRVTVRVLEVNSDKKQIALTMRWEKPAQQRPEGERRPERQSRPPRGERPPHRDRSQQPRQDRPEPDRRDGGGRPDPRRDGPRPDHRRDHAGGQGGGKPHHGGFKGKPREKPLFNNPFAVLAGKFPPK